LTALHGKNLLKITKNTLFRTFLKREGKKAADNLLSLPRFLLILIRIIDNKLSGIAYHRYRQMFSGGFLFILNARLISVNFRQSEVIHI